MPGGRPRKYKTKAELQRIIDAYFSECDPHWIEEEYWDYPFIDADGLEPQAHGGALKRATRRDYNAPMTKQKRMVQTEAQPYTVAGLARRLGLSRQAFMEYKRNEEFGDAILEARDRIGEYNEIMLHKGKSSRGAEFNLRVNFQYREKAEENPPPENPLHFINNVPIG